MARKRKFASDFLEDMHAVAQDLHDIDVISSEEMREFDELCFEPEDTDSTENPFDGLDKLDIESLAHQIGASVEFVAKLQFGSLNFSTIPASFVKLVAKVLGVPVNQLTAHLSSAETTNVDDQESFEEAISSSALSSDQKKNLRSFVKKSPIRNTRVSRSVTGIKTENAIHVQS